MLGFFEDIDPCLLRHMTNDWGPRPAEFLIKKQNTDANVAAPMKVC